MPSYYTTESAYNKGWQDGIHNCTRDNIFEGPTELGLLDAYHRGNRAAFKWQSERYADQDAARVETVGNPNS